MSMNAIAWCMKQKIKDQTDWSILMRICDHYNDSLGYAYPSQNRIADQIQSSTKTVQRHIKNLVEQGYLQVERSPNKVNKYAIPALKMDATTVSSPDLDATQVSYEHILDNIILSDDIIPLTNISSNNIVKGTKINFLTSNQWLWKHGLEFLKNNAPKVRNHRTVLARLINDASGNKNDYRERACDELQKVFQHCMKNDKHNLIEYLNASVRNIADKFKEVKKPKELSEKQKLFIESLIKKIQAKSYDSRFSYSNYDKIREDMKIGMLNKDGSFEKICEYYELEI